MLPGGNRYHWVMRVLVTGATGYIGGRLTPRLIEQGHDVTVLVRDRARYAGRPEARSVTIIEADLLDPDSLVQLGSFDAAYYLVHAMMGGQGFEKRDVQAATHFARAMTPNCHVIYLGGLIPSSGTKSAHLQSRAETGQALARGLPERVTEFRAGPVIGSGSASFEMVRYLTERLPVMVTPRWVRTTVEPIAVRDVLAYLISALNVGPQGVVEIGAGPLTFAQMMQTYARCRGLPRRWIIPTPVLAPGLASRWVGFFTPIPNRLARPLVQGMLQPLVADTAKARRRFPEIEPIDYESAVRLALNRTEKDLVETRWSGSLGADAPASLVDRQGLIREVRTAQVNRDPPQVFATFTSLGGDAGWPAWNWAWIVRGWVDKLIGGPGLRRGRRHPTELLEGEAIDFWRVEKLDPPHLLRLRAEMKLPGKAWLQWETAALTTPDAPNANPNTAPRHSVPHSHAPQTLLTQTALFEPKGLLGAVYWYALFPLHSLIFSQMVTALAQRAQKRNHDRQGISSS